jgi:hypothetical protein
MAARGRYLGAGGAGGPCGVLLGGDLVGDEGELLQDHPVGVRVCVCVRARATPGGSTSTRARVLAHTCARVRACVDSCLRARAMAAH